jgi:alpha-L-arabinofuranosidase
VNSQEEGTTARLNLKNFNVRSAKLIRLRANTGYDENTLQQPTAISPTEHELSPECNTVELDLPPYSLNIVRIKK